MAVLKQWGVERDTLMDSQRYCRSDLAPVSVLLERPAVEQEYRDENGDPNKASREGKGAAEEKGHRVSLCPNYRVGHQATETRAARCLIKK
jgi:hypothetical protein